MTTGVVPSVAYEKRLRVDEAEFGSADDVDGGPCGVVANGDGAWTVIVLDRDSPDDVRMACVSIYAPDEDNEGYVSTSIYSFDVNRLIEMRDSLTAAIEAMK